MAAEGESNRPANRYAQTAVDRQRQQIDRLLKDPSKPAYVPPPPKEKTIRPPREMMKNVQGSSAGAGSGEFHVYKAGRRREYERLKLLDDQTQKEVDKAEFERKRKEAEEAAEAKTAKNRAKRQKKKERAKAKGAEKATSGADNQSGSTQDFPIKKRRLVNGKELVFKRPEDDVSDEDDGFEGDGPTPLPPPPPEFEANGGTVALSASNENKLIIHEDD